MLNRENLQDALEGYVKVNVFLNVLLFTSELALPTQNVCFNGCKRKIEYSLQQVETNLSIVL